MVRCPSCGRQQEPQLVCGGCGAPQPVEVDCFAALALPRTPVVDQRRLETAYRDLSRKIHPDRFANSPTDVRDASLRGTALLTRSYRTLKDPVSRGLYWLELHGRKLAENNKSVPADLAEMVFEIQEQLAELRAANGAHEIREQINGRREATRQLMEEAKAELELNFGKWAGNGTSDSEELADELKKVLSRIAYLRTLLRDIDRELEPATAS